MSFIQKLIDTKTRGTGPAEADFEDENDTSVMKELPAGFEVVREDASDGAAEFGEAANQIDPARDGAPAANQATPDEANDTAEPKLNVLQLNDPIIEPKAEPASSKPVNIWNMDTAGEPDAVPVPQSIETLKSEPKPAEPAKTASAPAPKPAEPAKTASAPAPKPAEPTMAASAPAPKPAEPTMAASAPVPKPEEPAKTANAPTPAPQNTGRRRAGRVKTRLLGFERDNQSGVDLFDPETAVGKVAQAKFPVGWVVVVDGPGRGESFSLQSGMSQIGRGDDQAVHLDFGDASISRNNHAAIVYDVETHTFLLGHGGKANVVRLNGKPLLSTEELKNADLVRIGETTLRLIILCNPEFNWEEDNSEGADDVEIA